MSSTSLSVGARRGIAALRILLVLTLGLGLAYPLLFTGAAQLLASDRAGGAYVENADGDVVGSSLIGQTFDEPQWFHSRPSAAGEGYDALSSSASNLAADNPDLIALVQERQALIAAEEGVDTADIPADAVLASASGLDPHISPEYARVQIDRVAAERGLDRATVANLVEDHIEGRQLGFLGEPRVNVLLLNLALQRLGE
jgi:K+-transporting ATPase ATPase C chain